MAILGVGDAALGAVTGRSFIPIGLSVDERDGLPKICADHFTPIDHGDARLWDFTSRAVAAVVRPEPVGADVVID